MLIDEVLSVRSSETLKAVLYREPYSHNDNIRIDHLDFYTVQARLCISSLILALQLRAKNSTFRCLESGCL